MMRHMLLGLLQHHGARDGYALMKEIRARTGVQVSIGNVYRELARLAREGLVRSTPNPPEMDPRRAPYEITAAGTAAFDAWLAATPTRTQAPVHDEFSARALFLGQRSEEHTSELQSRGHLVCRLLLDKKNAP